MVILREGKSARTAARAGTLSLSRVIFWDPAEPTATRPLAVNVIGDQVYFPTVDLTKNVCELIDFYGNVAATYDYAPFGAVTAGAPSGASVPANPIQFSSEFYDPELDLVYYNYRHYSPSLGRWLSRDPIEEQGGLNLYAFVANQSISSVDRLGYAKLEDIVEMLVAIENTCTRCSKCESVVRKLRALEEKIYKENEKNIEQIMGLVRDFSTAAATYASGKKKVIDLTLFLEDVFGKENVNTSALKDLSGGLGRVANVLGKIGMASDVGESLSRKDGLDLFLTITNQFPVAQILTGYLKDGYRAALEGANDLKYNSSNKTLINEARATCRLSGGCCAAETLLARLLG